MFVRSLSKHIFGKVICEQNIANFKPKWYSYKVISRPDIKNAKLPKGPKEFSLQAVLCNRIKFSGPLTLADFMKEVLTHPLGGYYITRDMFGGSGDFVTSPEVSQIFSDILGIWLIAEWQMLGQPKPIQIVELGPGRGTMISDILRITKQVDLGKDNVSIHLVELSPTLRKIQADKLCMQYSTKDDQPHIMEGETVSGIKVYWYNSISDVPKKFSLFIAHEFFDALPIHKFQKTETGWREILVDVDPSSLANGEDKAKFKYVISPEETLATKLYVEAVLNGRDAKELEVSPQSLSIVKELAQRVDEFGGISLIIDYGHEGNKGDTFRAFKKHQQIDPLVDVGTADLTADVDFDQMKRAIVNGRVFGPITQRQFLQASFANVRLELMLECAKDHEKDIIKSGYEMLTHPDKMGDKFKFMAIFPTIDDDYYKKFPVLGFQTV